MNLDAQIITGRGKGASHIRASQAEIREVLGKEIVQGTLNLILRSPLLLKVDTAKRFDHDFRLVWPAHLNGKPVWLYRWRHAPLHVVEVIATDHLRSALDLQDRDVVTIRLDRKHIDKIPVLGRIAWILIWLGRKEGFYTDDDYYNRVRGVGKRFGATQLGINDSLPVLTMAFIKEIIKRIPVLGPLARRVARCLGNEDAPGISSHRSCGRFERLNTEEGKDAATNRVRNLLNYTKHRGSAYAAETFPAGYHTLRIGDTILRGQRDPIAHLEGLPIELKGKRVLNIGCNQGGMLFSLKDQIEWGVGIDFDYRMINAAQRIRSHIGAHHLDFYVFDLEQEPLDLIRDFLPEGKADVTLLLSVCMWIANWPQVMDLACRTSDVMVFESNGSDQQQVAQEKALRRLYRNVSIIREQSNDDPSQKRRKLFLAEDPTQ